MRQFIHFKTTTKMAKTIQIKSIDHSSLSLPLSLLCFFSPPCRPPQERLHTQTSLFLRPGASGEENSSMTLINYNPWGTETKPGREPTRLGRPSSKLSSRVSDKFDRTKEKTKEAAKKVKDGASTGVNWIKVKCNKNKLFPKK